VSDVFLGTIAFAVLVMAIIQVAAIVFAARAARRVGDAFARLEQDVRPIIANLQALSADAARATALAASQVERADQMLGALRDRLEQTVILMQQNLLKPMRDLMAMIQAFKEVFFGGDRNTSPGDRGRRQPVEEEDALFIG
jgi:hypothetical protein